MIKKFGAVAAIACLTLSLVACGNNKTGVPEVKSKGVGTVPEISFPSANPPEVAYSKVLNAAADNQATKVGNNDLVLVDYKSWVWKGKELADSTLGGDFGPTVINMANLPLSGWNKLVGAQVGSRLMLVLPPDYAYGAAGNEGLGVPADSTLVYVVDVLATTNVAKASTYQVTAVPATLPTGVSADITNLEEPAFKVVPNSPFPQAQTILLAKGNGAAVGPEQTVALRAIQVGWDGQEMENHWNKDGLLAIKASAIGIDSMTLGSVVVVTTPANGAAQPTAALMQLVDVFNTAR